VIGVISTLNQIIPPSSFYICVTSTLAILRHRVAGYATSHTHSYSLAWVPTTNIRPGVGTFIQTDSKLTWPYFSGTGCHYSHLQQSTVCAGFPEGAGSFRHCDQSSGAHRIYRGLLPRLTLTAERKNAWRWISTSPHIFVACVYTYRHHFYRTVPNSVPKQRAAPHERTCLFSLSSGYDVCIIDAFFSRYTVVDIMTVGNANLHAVLVRCSSYFRVWREDVDRLIDVLGSSFCR
jgi:hypothetical protein